MKFKDQKIRLILNKYYENDPVIIVRGVAIDENTQGILISGRIFLKVLEEDKMVEKPIDNETKLIFVPFSTIRFLEFIIPGSKYDELNKRVLKESLLSTEKIDRTGAF
jgi:F0F1-type ATP synthase alpha subunit